MADYDDGCRVKSISIKCPTKKSRTSSSPPISRRENASGSRRHSRQSSKSLAKTCKSGSHKPVAPRSRIHERMELLEPFPEKILIQLENIQKQLRTTPGVKP